MKTSAALILTALMSLTPMMASAQSETTNNTAAQTDTQQAGQSAIRLDHAALRVVDLERSIEFYNQAFDLELKTRWDSMTLGTGDKAMTVELAGAMLQDDKGGVIELFGDGVEAERQAYQQPINHFGFAVTDINAAYEQALKAGATAVTPPTQVSARGMGATIAFVLGPDSERIELIQYKN